MRVIRSLSPLSKKQKNSLHKSLRMVFKIVILGSGKGSNARAILEAEHTKRLGKVQTVAVLSDIQEAPILKLAASFGKPFHAITSDKKRARLSADETKLFVEKIKAYKPDLIVLAGFMRIIDSGFIKTFQGKIINLHPSLLPNFPGIDAIKKAYESPLGETGCTVHWVTPALDAGPIIAQKSVLIDPSDSLESLTQKVHAAEHILLPEVILRLSSGAINFPNKL